jgi:hypothetical protein
VADDLRAILASLPARLEELEEAWRTEAQHQADMVRDLRVELERWKWIAREEGRRVESFRAELERVKGQT